MYGEQNRFPALVEDVEQDQTRRGGQREEELGGRWVTLRILEYRTELTLALA